VTEQGGNFPGSYPWPRTEDDSQAFCLDSSVLFWRRALTIFMFWTLVMAISLGASINDTSHQNLRINQVSASAAASGDRALQDQLDVWRRDLGQASLMNITLHGLFWLLGGGVILLVTRQLVQQSQQRNLARTLQRENEIEFRTTMEATTVGIFRIKNMRFDFVNTAMATMYGYSTEDFLKLSPMDIVIPEEREWVEENTRRRAAGEQGHPYQVTSLRQDGTTFNGLVWTNRIFYRGKPSTVGSMLDITERIQAEQDMRRMVDALAASNMELERFAYVASHDLQEPLRSITSFSQLLERRAGDKLDDEAKEYLHYIIIGGKRMYSLVNDLLTFSRVSRKGTPFALVETRDLVELALQNLRESIHESAAEITLGDLPAVVGDGMQLVQLFQNLIGNALKFRRPGNTPHIAVQARRQVEDYLFSVTDDGVGIPTEYQEQIFALFRRLHKGEAYPGTGVGLAICKRVIERHEGRIWVESTPGHGSTFLFTLPAPGTQRAQALTAREEASEEQPQG